MQIASRLGINKVVLALSTARFADALGNSILIIIIPLYVASISTGNTTIPQSILVGVLISLYGLTNSVLQPLMGALSDRFHRRKPFILVGLLMMAFGTLAFLFASRFRELVLIRMFQGIGVAMTVPASMAIMATTTEKNTRGGAMGVYSTMRMLGFALGPLLGGFLHVQFGFQSAFYAGFGFVILAAILVQFLVDEQPAPQQIGPVPPFRVINREIWTASIISLGLATFFMASGYSMMSALENEFNQRLEQTALGFGIAFSAMTFSRLIVQVPLGRLSDVIGRKRLIISGLILMAPATALLGMVGTTLQLTGLRAIQGVVSAAIAAPAFALAGDLSQAGGEGQQMSVLTTGFFLGIALGPLFAGFLAVYLFELPFILGGIFTLVGAWVVYQFVPETVHRARRS